MNIAVITARGGSKRIPRKNIKDFLGKPIIAYSIEAAEKSNLFSEIMVSTDDAEIATIAKKYGTSVPFLRSKKNADNHSVLADVIIEVINEYKKAGISFENICCVLPTAPFLKYNALIDSYNLLLKDNLDAVIPLVQFSYPIQRALKIENNKVSMVWPENEKARSQDLMLTYHDAGQFYWLNSKSFLDQKKLYMKNTGAIILSELEVHDIDTEEDWFVAENKYKLLRY